MVNHQQASVNFPTKGVIPMSQVSMRQGFWFYFTHNGHDISVHGSAWSGKESVYVNNHPVSIKRNLMSFTGEHHFEHDGVKYKVKITVASILRGQIVTELYADGELAGKESLAMTPNEHDANYTKKSRITFIAIFVGFFLVGMAAGYFGVSGISALFGG